MIFIDMRYRAVLTLELKVIQRICSRETIVPSLPYAKALNTHGIKIKIKIKNLGSMEMIPLSAKIPQTAECLIQLYFCEAELATPRLAGPPLHAIPDAL